MIATALEMEANTMVTLDAKQVWFVEATIVSNMGLIFIQKMTAAKNPMGVVVSLGLVL